MIGLHLKFSEHVFSNHDVQRLGLALEDVALSHASIRNSDENIWQLSWFFDHMPDLQYLSDTLNISLEAHGFEEQKIEANQWKTEEIADDTDWLSTVYRQNPPVSVPPFYIYGSHYDGEIPDDYIALNIDAITAFGSGDHGTTKGCLRAMAKLKEDGVCPWNILDMGTGSGILAIAACKLWKTPVLGIDIEAEAINVCLRHAAQNNVKIAPQDLTFMHGDGFQTQIVQDKHPFDLIIANILAAPLKTMAKDMHKMCDENGYIILSGILNEQADDVQAVYTAVGFKVRAHDVIGEWSTLVMQK